MTKTFVAMVSKPDIGPQHSNFALATDTLEECYTACAEHMQKLGTTAQTFPNFPEQFDTWDDSNVVGTFDDVMWYVLEIGVVSSVLIGSGWTPEQHAENDRMNEETVKALVGA